MTQVAVIHSAFEDVSNTVAFVEVGERTGEEALQYAFRWTNNVMGSWSIKEETLDAGYPNGDYNEDVTVMAPLHVDENGKEWGHRSTSVGDMMLLDGVKYEVGEWGFEEVA